MATWKILDADWIGGGPLVPLQCECGREANVQTREDPGVNIVAAVGMGVVFDVSDHMPPKSWMPKEIQCRKCKRIYGNYGE